MTVTRKDRTDVLDIDTKPSPGTLWPLDPLVWSEASCNACYGRGMINLVGKGREPCRNCVVKRFQKARAVTGACVECDQPARFMCGFCRGRHCAGHNVRENHASAIILPVYGRGPWSPACAVKNKLTKAEERELVKLGTIAWDVTESGSGMFVLGTWEVRARGDRKEAAWVWLTRAMPPHGLAEPPLMHDDLVGAEAAGVAMGTRRLREIPGALLLRRYAT